MIIRRRPLVWLWSTWSKLTCLATTGNRRRIGKFHRATSTRSSTQWLPWTQTSAAVVPAGANSGASTTPLRHHSRATRTSSTRNRSQPRKEALENSGFDHSVDLYHPEKHIAIEMEKSERKRVSDDLLKFINGGQTYRKKGHKIEFGALIVPTNYRGSGNIFGSVATTLDFMRGVLHVEDVAVVGYRDPRWD
jgi:hypothetical protein